MTTPCCVESSEYNAVWNRVKYGENSYQSMFKSAEVFIRLSQTVLDLVKISVSVPSIS